MPGAAWAEACSTARPGWDGTTATPFDEAWTLFLTPFGLLLLAFTGSLRDLCGLMSGVLFGAPPDVVVPT